MMLKLFFYGFVFLLANIANAHWFRYDFPSLSQPVGVEEMNLVDQSRVDPHGVNGIKRELQLVIWYPAKDAKEKPFATWGYSMRESILTTMAVESGFPKFFIEPGLQEAVRSKIGLSVKSGIFPLVIILDGLGGSGNITEETDLAESLVNAGFIVVGVNSPFGSSAVKLSQTNEVVGVSKKLNDIMSRYPGSRPELITYRKEEHALWASDVEFLVRELKTIQSPALQHIDWNQINIVGFSHGGFAAIEACERIDVCRSSINMDGYTYEQEVPTKLKHHLTLFQSGTAHYLHDFCNGRTGCMIQEINDCPLNHEGFSDAIYSKWPFTRFTGNQCGEKSVEVKKKINDEVIRFLSSGSI